MIRIPGDRFAALLVILDSIPSVVRKPYREAKARAGHVRAVSELFSGGLDVDNLADWQDCRRRFNLMGCFVITLLNQL
jgi:hypothetical protein